MQLLEHLLPAPLLYQSMGHTKKSHSSICLWAVIWLQFYSILMRFCSAQWFESPKVRSCLFRVEIQSPFPYFAQLLHHQSTGILSGNIHILLQLIGQIEIFTTHDLVCRKFAAVCCNFIPKISSYQSKKFLPHLLVQPTSPLSVVQRHLDWPLRCREIVPQTLGPSH